MARSGVEARPGAAGLAPALGLFFLAPFVAEFLLGDIPLSQLGSLVLLAPLYGGGALVIRETARRASLSWPALLLLCLAFGIVEEAFVTQTLFNPNYLGFRLLDAGYIPALGIGTWWTAYVLTIHTVWSTAVPIALMETLASPPRRRTPWLRPWALGLCGILYLGACVALGIMERTKGFFASAPQLAGAALALAALVALAFLIPRPAAARISERPIPAPRALLALGALAGALFMAAVFSRDLVPAAASVGGMALVLATTGALLLRWSRSPAWGERHRLAFVAGLVVTYAWHGFTQAPVIGHASRREALLGNVLFAAAALLLLALAAVRLRRLEPSPAPAAGPHRT